MKTPQPKSAPYQKYFVLGIILVAFALFGAGCAQKGAGQAIKPQQQAPIAVEEEDAALLSEPEAEVGTAPTPVPKIRTGAEIITAANCDAIPDRLASCASFTCTFTHPLTGDILQKEIKGVVSGKCLYVEQMPNRGKMTCNYSESARRAVSRYYRDAEAAESVGTRVELDLGSGQRQTVYTIDGRQVENPLQDAMDTGVCVISGYGQAEEASKCPSGKVYKGSTFTYESGRKIEHPVCSDPTEQCSACANCASGSMKKVTSNAGEVCKECLFSSDCKSGFSCIQDRCVAPESQGAGSPCRYTSDCPSGTHCAPQDVCVSNSIADQFDSCATSAARDECESRTCANCKSGTYLCPFSDKPINKKCVECFMDLSCKKGFQCESYRCVQK